MVANDAVVPGAADCQFSAGSSATTDGSENVPKSESRSSNPITERERPISRLVCTRAESLLTVRVRAVSKAACTGAIHSRGRTTSLVRQASGLSVDRTRLWNTFSGWSKNTFHRKLLAPVQNLLQLFNLHGFTMLADHFIDPFSSHGFAPPSSV